MTDPPVEMITGYLRRVVAPNPGPMTLDGTNTWIVGDPLRGAVVVADPGPADDDHLRLIMEACAGGIADIVLTHRHSDHSDGAPVLAALAGCGVRAADPTQQIGVGPLVHGELITVPGAELVAISTPGHTSDSTSLLVHGEDAQRWLVSGDMVLGRGTAVITSPDGDLAAYLESLDVMEAAVLDADVKEILPGHGPRVTRPLELLRWYRQHRLERLEQVRAALAAGARTASEVVAIVYADIDPSLRLAAAQSVAAQLEYLSGPGSR
ncbi:MAG: MBL-fold metallo-hydrolase superfamily [uncultured Propionibacteriaceae bacterium]|uniref:MBL-fold metallo-hydrolase superfamily n=1 Tax=uncultured Propionibacteriaceae bacterium TaxID=257457 RepID=A0A6J4P394_9ACTN|nr:MAG: MBL-fold metallo-hydrolase superfamily [uncultured Propionibacteriaceae bacterium]